MKYVLGLFAAIAATLFVSCGESVRSDGNAESFSIQAAMYKTSFGTGDAVRSDTLSPGDSIFFTANILPSRNIRLSTYFWTFDSLAIYQVFNVRRAFDTSGEHLAIFHVVDAFGDTLSDTLRIRISSPPVCDTNVAPANRGHALEPDNVVFSWNCPDPDPGDHPAMRFKLFLNGQQLLDSTLTGSSLRLPFALQPLQAYQWSVIATDPWGMGTSGFSNYSFSTKGSEVFAGISASLATGYSASAPMTLSCTPLSGGTVNPSAESTGPWQLGGIAPGKYRCRLQSSRWPDLNTGEQTIEAPPGRVAILPGFPLKDTTAPVVFAPTTDSLLAIADTIRFVVVDGAPGNLGVSVYLDGKSFDQWNLVGDTLYVLGAKLRQPPSIPRLSVLAKDLAGNSKWYHWRFSPRHDWIKTLPDTSLYINGQVNIFICNLSTVSEASTYLWDAGANGSIDARSSADTACPSMLWQNSSVPSIFRVGIVYANGQTAFHDIHFTQKNTTNQAPSAVKTLWTPANRTTVGTNGIMTWSPSSDPDGDSVYYQVSYRASTSEQWSYGPETADTSLAISSILITPGQYYWNVRTLDGKGNATPSDYYGLFILEATP